MADVTCIADLKMVLGEGPIWVEREQALYWLDIKGRKIFRLDGRGKLEQWETPFRVGSLAPTRDCADDGRAGRHGQRVELRHPLGGVGIAEVEGDEECAVAAAGTLKHGKGRRR